MQMSGCFMPWLLYPPGKEPWYPVDRRLRGPQSWSGHTGEEKNSQPLTGLGIPIIQPVAQHYIAELSRLLLFSVVLHFKIEDKHRVAL
jgi:hypothetical protein